jgi:primosomal protein N' (replication factor Y)
MSITFADIILPIPLPKLFTYEVPAEFRGLMQKGLRVIVPFGKKKQLSGIVFEIHNNKPELYDTKPIIALLDNDPLVTEKQLALWQWISTYYQCSLGEVYKAAIPSGFKLESETRFFYNAEFEATTALPEKANMVLDYLAKEKYCSISDLNKITGLKNSFPILKSLMEQQAVFFDEHMAEKYKAKVEPYLALHPEMESENVLKNTFDLLERAPKQLQLLMSFIQKAGGVQQAFSSKKILKKELLDGFENGAGPLSELIKKNVLVQELLEVDRLDFSQIKLSEKKKLSEDQNTALTLIKQGFDKDKPVLFHGVTSSGKTEIYIQLIDEVIKQGKQALYLLPEIALTTQITTRLKAYFGNKLGIYHSKFSDDERVEVWNDLLLNKNYQIILGVRSSIFLPFTNLGLVIIDEEHENSFKQYDPAPRYHARDVALVLAKSFNASVLLGTATPSIESYYNAKTDKFHLVELQSRFEGMSLPEIRVVNTREAYRKKSMQSHFTPDLIELMGKALQNKEQVILFQNRRGFAPYLECDKCAWIPRCSHCDVSMTYHKNIDQLVCHYCGHSVATYKTCQACGNPSLFTKGFGTQKIEEEIKAIFPDAAVARMDYDTTRSKTGYDKIIASFEQGKHDILVGTQMVTKGLDFDRVSLVGILNADNMLNNPDFRAFERSFQMIAQVSGRAGRKNKRGTVILQTANPEHPVIQYVKINNYTSFYNQQIEEREQFKYPPFYRLIFLTIKHKNPNTSKRAAVELANKLRAVFGNRIIGPQVPPVTKIQDLHLQRILIKLERNSSHAKAKDLVQDCMNHVLSRDPWRYVTITVDVDPY